MNSCGEFCRKPETRHVPILSAGRGELRKTLKNNIKLCLNVLSADLNTLRQSRHDINTDKREIDRAERRVNLIVRNLSKSRNCACKPRNRAGVNSCHRIDQISNPTGCGCGRTDLGRVKIGNIRCKVIKRRSKVLKNPEFINYRFVNALQRSKNLGNLLSSGCGKVNLRKINVGQNATHSRQRPSVVRKIIAKTSKIQLTGTKRVIRKRIGKFGHRNAGFFRLGNRFRIDSAILGKGL